MTDADLSFAESLYASTRAEEIARTGWPAEQQRAFLAQQHRAQHHHHRSHYPDAEWLIVMREGKPIGRLYLRKDERETMVIDISLVASERGRGLGGAILADVVADAAAARHTVSLHVEQSNPARSLYLRLGFRVVEDKGFYLLMEWQPTESPPERPT